MIALEAMLEVVQSPIAGRALHRHARALGGCGCRGVGLLGGGVGVRECPFRGHDEGAHGVGCGLFLVPVVGAGHTLPLRLVPVFFHVEDRVEEIPVEGGGLVPALQAQIALFQPFHVHLHPLGIHRVDGPIVAVVAFHHEPKNILVHAHCLAVMAHAGVQLRKQLGHLERLGVEGAPDAAEIVANVFAQSDGARAMIFVGVCCLHVSATDGDDRGGRPFLLDFAGRPE